MDWRADESVLEVALELARNAGNGEPNVMKRMNVLGEELKNTKECNRYLCLIFVEMRSENVVVRLQAGYVLKAWLSMGVGLESVDYVRSRVLQSLCDESCDVRRAGAAILSTMIDKFGCKSFPWVELLNLLRGGNIVGGLMALKMIVEDQMMRYDQTNELDDKFVKVSNENFIPLLLDICTEGGGASSDMIELSLQILQSYNSQQIFAGEAYFDRFWSILGQIGGSVEATTPMKLIITQAMITILDYNRDYILSHHQPVFEFMIKTTDDADNYELRLSSLYFWPYVIKDLQLKNCLQGYLSNLVPVLLKHTVYTDMDYSQLDQAQFQEDNSTVPDLAHSLQPRFHNKPINRQGGEPDSSLDTRDDQEDGEEEIKSAWGDTWTVRKGAAYALDSLAVAYKEQILPYSLPLIEQRLQNHDSWEIRESGVLALGAITRGCISHLDQYVPNVLTLLLTLTQDPKPLLRSISCWCLNRFSPWICDNKPEYLQPVLQALLARTLDRNKCVQEAACSALAGLEETAQLQLVPFLPQIYQTFNQAFKLYQAKNLLILYDSIGTLAERIGKAFVEAFPKHHSQQVLQPLFQKWVTLQPQDFQIGAICECMAPIALALGPEIAPMAPNLVSKCYYLMHVALNDPNGEPPNLDTLESCLSLLSAVADSMGDLFPPVVATYNFMPVVERCCVDANLDTVDGHLKQSTFALIGDLAVHCSHLMIPHLPAIVPALASSLKHRPWAVCSNASWALGQLVEQVPNMETYADFIATQFAAVLTPGSHLPFLQNACITLGRFAASCPENISRILDDILPVWTSVMSCYQTENEKIKSFRGICIALNHNPLAAKNHARALLACVASFIEEDISKPLSPAGGLLPIRPIHGEIETVLRELICWLEKQCGPEMWTEALRGLSEKDNRLLRHILVTGF